MSQKQQQQQQHRGLSLGHHTLSMERNGVLSSGLDRMLVGNRGSVGLTQSTISSFNPI